MTTPIIIFAIAILVIVAIIFYMILLATSKYDPSEKEKEDQHYLSSCSQRLFMLNDNADLFYETK